MGSIYTEAQKEASKRYAAATDQIRVRTIKGNLEFIKKHAESMYETMGEFVNRAIINAIFSDRGEQVVMDVESAEYGIAGKLLKNSSDNYEIAFYANNRFIVKELLSVSDVPEAFIEDYAWMALEDEYENIMLGGE